MILQAGVAVSLISSICQCNRLLRLFEWTTKSQLNFFFLKLVNYIIIKDNARVKVNPNPLFTPEIV